MIFEILGFICFFGVVAAASYRLGYVHAEEKELVAAFRASNWSYRQGLRDNAKLGRLTLVGGKRRIS